MRHTSPHQSLPDQSCSPWQTKILCESSALCTMQRVCSHVKLHTSCVTRWNFWIQKEYQPCLRFSTCWFQLTCFLRTRTWMMKSLPCPNKGSGPGGWWNWYGGLKTCSLEGNSSLKKELAMPRKPEMMVIHLSRDSRDSLPKLKTAMPSDSCTRYIYSSNTWSNRPLCQIWHIQHAGQAHQQHCRHSHCAGEWIGKHNAMEREGLKRCMESIAAKRGVVS